MTITTNARRRLHTLDLLHIRHFRQAPGRQRTRDGRALRGHLLLGLVLGVTLYAITRPQAPDLALPLLVFELTLAAWPITKSVAAPARSHTT